MCDDDDEDEDDNNNLGSWLCFPKFADRGDVPSVFMEILDREQSSF